MTKRRTNRGNPLTPIIAKVYLLLWQAERTKEPDVKYVIDCLRRALKP